MARRSPRPEATQEKTLTPLKESCEQCGQPLWVARIGANLSVLGSVGRHQSSQFLAEPSARSGLLMGSLLAFAREQIALEQRKAALKMLAGPSTPQEHGQILQALLCEEPIAHYPLLSGFILFQVCFIPITLGKPGELRELLTHPKLLLF